MVVDMVSSSNDLNVIQVMGIDGWEADTTVVHLSGEDLITVEVVTEETTVRVGEVVRISHGHIWEGSKESMH